MCFFSTTACNSRGQPKVKVIHLDTAYHFAVAISSSEQNNSSSLLCKSDQAKLEREGLAGKLRPETQRRS